VGALEGKVALITGTSKGGIGTAIAERFAAEGARVAMAARDEEGLRAALARVEAAGSTGAVFTCDLSLDDGGRDTLVARAEAALGPVDILVNNSAAGGYKPFTAWPLADLRRMQEVNVWAPWVLAQHTVASLRARGHGGAIINISSASADVPQGPVFLNTAPSRAGAAYGGTKAMLNRMTISLAHELLHESISANTLSPHAAAATPGLVASNWLDEGYFEPLETLAEAALALCGVDSRVCTGRVLLSLDYLVERGAPVFDLTGRALLDGWQPGDIASKIAVMRGLQNRA
jgi:NAD(P)-dependent dehydrogenase (short-subunit alcohol dehydrogenase family)